MASGKLQTKLLGRKVYIGMSDRHGLIVSVYLDKDGDPKYTVEIENGTLMDVYSHSFELVG